MDWDRPELAKRNANYVALTPISFLERAATFFAERTAVIDRERRFTYREFYARCRQLAHALEKAGVGRGDTVAILAANVTSHLEAHYAVPMLGAILNPINIRLDPALIRFCLEHGEAKVFLADREFHATIQPALDGMEKKPIVIDIADPETDGMPHFGNVEYEDFLASGDPAYVYGGPQDEWDAVCLLYTSGTTGNPKGVVFHHRGAHLNALSNAIAFKLDNETRYLWTLPMFHCSGWTYTWAVTAVGGTHVCLRTWLERHAPETRGDSVLVHGDFRTGNYLVDNGRLTAVLDWEFAHWGDPDEDLGWFCAKCWRFANNELEAGGIAPLADFITAYERAAGRTVDPARLQYWQIMAAAKWATIALLQGDRFRRGGETSVELALTGLMVSELELEALDGLKAYESAVGS